VSTEELLAEPVETAPLATAARPVV